MEKSIDSYFTEILGVTYTNPREYSPLSLAYIGDSVFDLLIKTLAVTKDNKQAYKYHKEVSQLVKAEAQAGYIMYLLDNGLLTEEEEWIYKRGRNTKTHSTAKNATVEFRRVLFRSPQHLKRVQRVQMEKKMQNREFENNIKTESDEEAFVIEGRNAVLEAFRSGKTIDKLYVLDGCRDGIVNSIVREAKKQDTVINYLSKEKLNQMSQAGKHQGVIAHAAAYKYAEIEDMFALAESRGEDPFFFILDEIEDPHNLGAIIRTANLCGAHGVIIPKRRAVGITATVVKASAGAINYTPVAKVTNISKTIEELKDRGMWFACADMDGELMYKCNLTGSLGLVIGNEGSGVSRLVKEKCDYVVSVPMKGDIDSLNASVAAGVLAYEVVRQRMNK